MKRIGICTGNLYSDDIVINNIHECCIAVDPAYPNDEGIEIAKAQAQLDRVLHACGKHCFGCLESQKKILDISDTDD